MRFRLYWVAVLALPGVSLSLAAESTRRPLLPENAPYRICRNVHQKSECVLLDEGCAHATASDSAPDKSAACAPITDRRCKAFQKLMKKGFEIVSALPSQERTLDSVPSFSCPGFILTIPGHSVVACIERQPDGARALSDLWNLSEELCDAK